jgi:hypothetical protein
MHSTEPEDPRGSEAGDTLVEVLLALVVIALTAVAILGAFATSISATSEHRTLATSDTALRSFAETFTYDVRLAPVTPQTPSNWVGCATSSPLPSQYANIVSGFNATSPAAMPTATQNGYAIAISAIANQGTCPATNPPPEQITATATYVCATNNPHCTQGGTSESSLQFVVSQPDQPESAINLATYTLNSTSAQATGGGTLTVTANSGTPFANATTVNFGSTRQPVLSIGGGGASVTATIPPENGSKYQVFISVTTPTGTTGAGPSDLFTYGPTVTNISPNTGPFVGGTPVTVTGTGFTATSTVSFGGTAGTVSSFNGSTTLIVTAPTGSGTVDVKVTNPALPASNQSSPTSSADQFTYAMSVTNVSPASGPGAGGTTLDIKGQGFTGVTGVTFGNVPVPASNITFVSDGEITAVSPPGTGVVDVQVTTPTGVTSRGASDQFSYVSGAMAGLGIQLNGASPSPKLSCTYNANGNNNCSISGVGCGGSATFYVQTVDGAGNPVVTGPGGQTVAVGKGATPSSVTVPQGSFTTYAAPPGSQSVTAQLPPSKCNPNNPKSETVTLNTTINGNPTTLTISVSSS